MYFVKTPWWLRLLYPSLMWRIHTQEKILYLTFDDGPHETATPFVLDQLKRYGAKATFFCVGNNVAMHPSIYEEILADGHSVGNHTQHHVNGWKVTDNEYIKEITDASALIRPGLFRPPYGRIRRSQQKRLVSLFPGIKTIMWDVLSADFDTGVRAETCAGYVLYHARPGSIIVFHDSSKAWERLHIALPKVLAHFAAAGYSFHAIPLSHKK